MLMDVQGGHAIQPFLRSGSSSNTRITVKACGICKGKSPKIEKMLSTKASYLRLSACLRHPNPTADLFGLLQSQCGGPNMLESMIGISVISRSCKSYE